MNNPFPKFWIIGPLPWTKCALLLPKADTVVPTVEQPIAGNVVTLFKPKPALNDDDNDLTLA